MGINPPTFLPALWDRSEGHWAQCLRGSLCEAEPQPPCMNIPAWLPLPHLTSPLLRASCDRLPNTALAPDSVSGATLQTTPKWLETATVSHFSRFCGWLSGSSAVWPSRSATSSWKVKAGLTHVIRQAGGAGPWPGRLCSHTQGFPSCSS